MNGNKFYSTLIIFSIYFLACVSKKNKQAIIDKEFAAGVKHFAPLVTIFNKAELSSTTTAFKTLCSNKNLTPTMKLAGYNYVFLSFERMKRYDSALMYADTCIYTIEQHNLDKYLPEFYLGFLLSKSLTLFNLNQPEEANEFFYKAKREIDRIDSISFKYMMIEKLGFVAYRQKNFNEAAQAFKKTLLLHQKTYTTNYYKTPKLLIILVCATTNFNNMLLL